MRELHGVMFESDPFPEARLKRVALLFDQVHIINVYGRLKNPAYIGPREQTEATVDYLSSHGLIKNLEFHTGLFTEAMATGIAQHLDEVRRTGAPHRFGDVASRLYANELSNADHDYTAICRSPLSAYVAHSQGTSIGKAESTLRVALTALPLPDEGTSWSEILEFRAHTRDKQWAFRRFLLSLATRQLSEAEIRDELEWSLHEYTKAMELHNIKASQSFVELFVISPLEIIENLVKLNWSKLAKGALSVRKRKVELLEAEMKAPGKECAYVFESRKRFISSSQ
jgi:hypothetical protein